MKTDFIIREATPHDARGIIEAHHAAVREKAGGSYGGEILEAWSPAVTEERVVRMKGKLAEAGTYTVVAEGEGKSWASGR